MKRIRRSILKIMSKIFRQIKKRFKLIYHWKQKLLKISRGQLKRRKNNDIGINRNMHIESILIFKINYIILID